MAAGSPSGLSACLCNQRKGAAVTALLDDVKVALRISSATTAYDSEINGLIAAAQSDLTGAGIDGTQATAATDALIKHAIITYCKAHFGSNNPDSEKLMAAYAMLVNKLALNADRTNFVVTFNCSAQCEVEFDGDTKWTSAAGVAEFWSRAQNHAAYSINGGAYVYIDVAADTTVTVTV